MNKLNCNHIIIATVMFVLLLATSSHSIAAVDMFLKLSNIPGESTDSTHRYEIDIQSLSLGMNQTGNAVMGPGKPILKDISFTKYVDASSPLLATAGVTGKIIPSALLTVRKAGSITLEYLKITLTNVMASSISSGGSNGQDRLTENVTFNFEQYKVEYTIQKADGTADGTIPSSYNIKTGTILDVILRAALTGSGSGNIYSITQGVYFSCTPDACPAQGFPYNTTMTLSATPSLLSLFTGWSDACTVINGNCQVTLDADKDINSVFMLADKARIGSLPGFKSFAEAYDASSGESTTIKLLEDTLPLVTTINKALVLEGGYNTDYSRSTNGYTTLRGTLSILGNGKVTADRIIVK